MSTGNYELGAFDRAIQASSLKEPLITEASKTVICTTAYFWQLYAHH